MIKDSDSDELREAYRLHQEACENLLILKRKYGVSKRARNIVTLSSIIEAKTGTKLKMSMKVYRDRGPDITIKSDFAYIHELMCRKAFLTGKISTLNGKKLRRKNGKYVYVRD